MPLLQAAEILVVVGVLLCLVNPFIPMQSSIKSILNAVGSDCGGCVAAQRVRALSFAIPHARRIVKDEFRQPART
ncbi:MAG: Thivi_2564 family membrane protein [Acidobacteriaceae bacterium]